ncbi:hypothetical protein EDF78_11329 [Rahnella sp. BIGb0236]|uniref:hypothetical protein n=1 Tax=Rahnella sp. BIGb0236 TaxID=2485117 RepID=UPI00105B7032|nr:hypothetical protein [Rahnella sp. BIGb0236]TDS87838.1 hypothetical protein EDF78_11329 [Rahnella sp. BIGb0236]VTQ61207.1 Uncharacterised protein [Campylobacter jejuni]
MKWLIVLVPVGLVGCAGRVTVPDPVYVEVKVPVQVPCDPGVINAPAFAVDRLPIGSSIDKQMQALRAERHQRIGYEKELNAAVDSCRATAKPG